MICALQQSMLQCSIHQEEEERSLCCCTLFVESVSASTESDSPSWLYQALVSCCSEEFLELTRAEFSQELSSAFKFQRCLEFGTYGA